MAITITVCNRFEELLFRGAIQTSAFGGYQEVNPFFVALRSAAITTDSSGSPVMRTSSGYQGNGTNLLTTSNGYIYEGQQLENVKLTYASGVVKMTADDVKWTATGAGFSARSALLCYELPMFSYVSGDRYGKSIALVGIDFGDNVTASNNRLFMIKWPAAGVFQWRMA